MSIFDPQTIDQVLDNNTDYSITYTYGLTPCPCHQHVDEPDNEDAVTTIFTGRGVTGVLESLTQVLVIVGENNLGTEDFVKAQARLDNILRERGEFSFRLREIRAKITRLTELIEEAKNEDSVEGWKLIQKRNRMEQEEGVVNTLFEGSEEPVKHFENRVKLAMAIEKITEQAKAGELNVNESMSDDVLTPAYVPQEEDRRTVGALVYYLMQRIAMSKTNRLVIEPIKAS